MCEEHTTTGGSGTSGNDGPVSRPLSSGPRLGWDFTHFGVEIPEVFVIVAWRFFEWFSFKPDSMPARLRGSICSDEPQKSHNTKFGANDSHLELTKARSAPSGLMGRYGTMS